MVTIRFYTEDFSEYIEIPHFEFGDALETVRGQSTRRDLSGKVSVTDRGFQYQMVAGLVKNVLHESMLNVLDFFGEDQVKQSLNRFWLRIPNERPDSGWNRMTWLMACGGTIAGGRIECGQLLDGALIDCGQRVPADYEWIGPLRLKQNGLKVSSLPARKGGLYEISLAAETEG